MLSGFGSFSESESINDQSFEEGESSVSATGEVSALLQLGTVRYWKSALLAKMICPCLQSLGLGGYKSPFSHSLLLVLGAFVGTAAAAADGPSLFHEQVAPVFARHCLRCHDGSGDNEVFLATRGDLFDQGWVIPGNFDDSPIKELLMGGMDSEPRMPPEGEPLSQSEMEILRSWINEGASWPEDARIAVAGRADGKWWSLQPIAAVDADSIDEIIERDLAKRNLKRSPRADRKTLIRRLSFDLHGLPPPSEAVQEFIDSEDPHAWGILVDRMLDSPRYGERYATHWLDLAHYADTHGFERDRRRPNAWRYRDYVIDAFNADKPYDRFLQEQIAGDVLWPENFDAVVATGFLSAGPWDYVGQVETKSPKLRNASRVLDLDDMVTQVMTSTIGMTVHCARCHDHKLDPISQSEYYQLQAVFAGVTRGDRIVSEKAFNEYESEKARLVEKRQQLAFELARLRGKGLSLADIVGGGEGLGTGQYRLGLDPRSAKVQTRDFGRLGNVVANQFRLSDYPFVDGVFIPDGENSDTPLIVSSEGTVLTGLPKTAVEAWDVIRNGPVASQHSPSLEGIDFTASDHDLLGLHANAGITFDMRPMREALGDDDLLFESLVGYFGSEGNYQCDVWVVLDGEIRWNAIGLQRKDGLQRLRIEIPASSNFLTLIATDGGNGISHDQLGFGDPRINLKTNRALSEDSQVRLVYLENALQEVDAELEELGQPPRVFGVISKSDPDVIRRLRRGDSESPVGDALGPAALACVGELNAVFGDSNMAEGARRAALAAWLTEPDHPLTYRVIANRVWQWHFGKGLVSTSSDFGSGGSMPTHPDLLDWLATQLRAGGGSLKSLHRKILLSETYCQESRVQSNAEGFQLDAQNDYLWKQNARRISAEAIRDSVLSVSGKLNPRRGGPGFEDFRYTEAYAPIYEYVTADDPELWRRSIYRYVVRTTPNKFLSTFDCPDPASLTPNRVTTTTPLQSLTLFNNEFFIRQSQYFADRLLKEAGESASSQVKKGFLLAYSREPDEDELRSSVSFVKKQGLFAFCRVLLNSNEFLYVD